MLFRSRFYYKGNRLKQLRAFVYTTRLGTLSRAAEALFLSQPSVSLQLKALERELGTHLLERTRRRITLTDAGEALYELARPLVDLAEGEKKVNWKAVSKRRLRRSASTGSGEK